MRLSNKLASFKALVLARAFGKRTPLLVSWEITRRCNARCKYCSIWDSATAELDTTRVFSLIRELAALGTRMIHFTGGEPLLREDFGLILKFCYAQGISTSLNSNGSLIPQRIAELATLKVLGVSVDGPKGVHDRVRGEGSFEKAVAGLEVAAKKGIQVRILTVLSRYNLDSIDFLLGLAGKLGASVVFQPATESLLGSDNADPVAPDPQKYRAAISDLINRKRGSQSRYIANSVSGLKFLAAWPKLKRIKCLAYLVSCRIESDGNVYVCFRNQSFGSMLGGGISVKKAFMNLRQPDCSRCCCSSGVEINCLMALKPDAILNTWESLSFFRTVFGRRKGR